VLSGCVTDALARYRDYGAVAVNWEMMGSEGRLTTRDPHRLVTEVLSFAASDAAVLYARPSHFVCIVSAYRQ
jgi:hypothetical protein